METRFAVKITFLDILKNLLTTYKKRGLKKRTKNDFQYTAVNSEKTIDTTA